MATRISALLMWPLLRFAASEAAPQPTTTGGYAVLKEFKEFITRGNVIDLAVAVVLGTAFGAVVTAFTNGIITPLIGAIGDFNFENWKWSVRGNDFRFGLVADAFIYFLIVAAVIFFLVVKPINAMAARRRGGAPAPEELSEEAALLTEIRDLLRRQQ
jgi:large conductance mechanosensitive channel